MVNRARIEVIKYFINFSLNANLIFLFLLVCKISFAPKKVTQSGHQSYVCLEVSH